ncbi:calponin [Aureococcus anophagefferens]|uniref:Calponin n=1 Tax=Aureococcus anophagefferens TaxID=44056 RepID=A0ABR1FWM9_AURAN
MDDLKVWIASMSKHDLDASKPLLECLRDGSALCQLINALRPHTVKKINKGSMHTKQVENLSHFLEGAAALGVTELFDAKRAHDLQDEALESVDARLAGGWADATLASGAKAMVLTKAGAFYLLINFNCGLRTRSVSMPFASFADLERPTVGDFTS